MKRQIKFRADWEGKEYQVSTRPAKHKDAKGWYKMAGYVLRLVTEHPFKNSRSYVLEHRLVVEENLGKFLHPNVQIHHKNQIRDDNRIENLEVLDAREHALVHVKSIEKRNPNGRLVAQEPIFYEIKFRLFDKDTGLTQVYELGKLINTTFRRGKFQFRGRFTGLLDKNGKEIWEGDILASGTKAVTPWEVVYKTAWGKYCLFAKNIVYSPKEYHKVRLS